MNQILKETDAVNASSKIREEIDEDYAQEMSSTGIFDEWDKEKIFLKLREKSKGREKFLVIYLSYSFLKNKY